MTYMEYGTCGTGYAREIAESNEASQTTEDLLSFRAFESFVKIPLIVSVGSLEDSMSA